MEDNLNELGKVMTTAILVDGIKKSALLLQAMRIPQKEGIEILLGALEEVRGTVRATTVAVDVMQGASKKGG